MNGLKENECPDLLTLVKVRVRCDLLSLRRSRRAKTRIYFGGG